MRFHTSTSILTLILTFLSFHGNGQTYYPMPVSEAQWDITRCFWFYPGGWYDQYSITMDGSDTIIHGQVYSKLYMTTHHLPGTEHDSIYTHFLGGMRESDSLVYMVSELLTLDTIERIIYDFRHYNVGDTIWTQVLTNGLLQFVPHIVTGIDAVEVEGEMRRRIHLRDEQNVFSEYWIEGVGSNLGLVYASYWLLTDNSYDLNCFYHDKELGFTNPEPQYSFCTPPLPEITCEPLTTSIPDIDADKCQLFPNPAINDITVTTSEEPVRTEIISATGLVFIRRPFEPILSINELPVGVYFLRLSGPGNQTIAIERFVKM